VVEHKIKFNLFRLRRLLELKKDREYTFREISEKTQIHVNTLHNLEYNKSNSISLGTMGKLLEFFHNEGMPIQIQDLFTVTTDEPEKVPVTH